MTINKTRVFDPRQRHMIKVPCAGDTSHWHVELGWPYRHGCIYIYIYITYHYRTCPCSKWLKYINDLQLCFIGIDHSLLIQVPLDFFIKVQLKINQHWVKRQLLPIYWNVSTARRKCSNTVIQKRFGSYCTLKTNKMGDKSDYIENSSDLC